MNQQVYHLFNQTLTDAMQAQPESPAGAGPGPEGGNPTGGQSVGGGGQGYLTVQVTLAQRAIPVEGARVIVTQAETGQTAASLVTDQSGNTPRISLPAPRAALSQAPGSDLRPYSVYNIRIEVPGYYVEEAVNVPIFDKVASLQPVSLRPLPSGAGPNREDVVDETWTAKL